MIENGQKISLEYTVFLEDGTQVDSNVGESPLIFVLGAHQVFPALEDAIVGLKVGDTKDVKLTSDQAYGQVASDAYREVELASIPDAFRHEGAVLGVQDPAGGVYPIRVHAIKDQKAVLDFNHPLAGKDLRFTIRVVGAD